MASYVLLAINAGGVIIGKEFVHNAGDEEFIQAMKTFRIKYYGFFVTFLTEQDLASFVRLIMEKRGQL